MRFSDIETRMRRFLRDPDAKVWNQDILIDTFNHAQEQFNEETQVLAKIVGIHIPPYIEYAIMHDWEESEIEGSILRAFCDFVSGEYVCTQEWEVEAILRTAPLIDGGYRATFPWERNETSETVLGKEIYKFPYDFSNTIMLIYDRDRLQPTTEEAVMQANKVHETHEGTPRYYYRVHDDQMREFVLYPRPSVFTSDTFQTGTVNVDCGYTFEWEEDELANLALSSQKVTLTTDDDYEAIFPWEEQLVDGDNNPPPEYDALAMYATNCYDAEVVSYTYGAVTGVNPTDHTIVGDYGTLADWGEAFSDRDTGAVVDYVDLDDNLLLIYKPRVVRVVDADDTIENWLDWQIKYIERLTLSLMYQVNNERYNPKLSELWKLRYYDGLGIMARYKAKRTAGRKPTLRGYGRRSWKHQLVDLPDTFESLHR